MVTRRILIVDDESHVRLSLKQVLEDAGYQITTAETARWPSIIWRTTSVT